MLEFELSKNEIKALKLFAAEPPGICFEFGPSGNGLILGMDPRSVLFIRTKCERITADERIYGCIPNDCFKNIDVKYNSVYVHLLNNTEGTIFQLGEKRTVFNPLEIDDIFSKLRSIIPKDVSNEAAQFDPDLLVKFKKAAKLLGETKNGDIAVGYNGRTSVALISLLNDYAFGLLMPMAVGESYWPTEAPDWVTNKPN